MRLLRRKIFYIPAVILILYAMAGFVALPMVAEKKLPEIASSAINGRVTVRDIDFNPFFFSASIHGLSVTQASGQPLLTAASVSANAELSSLLRMGPVLKSVEIRGPQIDLVRDKTGGWNFSDLVKKQPQPASAGKETEEKKTAGPESPIYFSVGKFRIDNAKIHFRDEAAGFETHAEQVNLAVDGITSQAGSRAAFLAGVSTRAGESIVCSGQFGLFPLAADARIRVHNVNVPMYAPYYEDMTGLTIKSGRVDVSADVHWPQAKSPSGQKPLVADGRIGIRSLAAVDPHTGNAVFEISEFSMPGIEVDMAGRTIAARGIFTRGGKVLCERTPDGGINFSRITPETAPTAGEKNNADDSRAPEPAGKEAAAQETAPWNVRCDTISVTDYTVTYSDRVPEQPVSMKIRRMNVRLYDFSLREESLSYWSVNSLTGYGAVSARGNIRLTPLVAELDFKATDIALNAADPYAAQLGADIEEGTLNIAGTIKAEETQNGFTGSYDGRLWIDGLSVSDIAAGPAKIDITKGGLDITSRLEAQIGQNGFSGNYSGDFSIKDLGLGGSRSESLGIEIRNGSLNAGGTIRAEISPDGFSGSYAGDVHLTDFALHDLQTGEPFLRFARLGLEKIRADSDPMGVAVKRLILQSPDISMMRSRQGSIIPILLAGGGKTTDAAKKPQKRVARQNRPAGAVSRPELVIGEIRVENGAFSFTDQFVEPGFSTTLDAIDARVTGFALKPADLAPFEITGRLANQAPFTIKGKVRTMQPLSLAVVDIAFSNIGMPLFTPYSRKYLGYEIQEGKLNLDLKYRIDSRRLNAQNQVVFNQFYLGKTVRSPDALNLPLKLALALLRDRAGKIRLDVPVQGDMSSPEFKLGGVIYSAFINLLKRIATSPFAALASLVPHAEELKYVDFAPASAQIIERGAKKLDHLETALYERPGLRLLIRPGADPQKDRAGFKQQAVEKLIEAEKPASGTTRLSPAQAHERYLRAACRTAGIDTEDMSVTEMENALKQTVKIPDERLLALARQRGEAVRNHLLADGRIKADRVFLENPHMTDLPRVEFKLEAR